VDEVTEAVCLIGAFAHDAAGLPVGTPESGIDPQVGIERRDENVCSSAVAFGMIVVACAFEADAAKCVW
jgi:hypothetical protein